MDENPYQAPQEHGASEPSIGWWEWLVYFDDPDGDLPRLRNVLVLVAAMAAAALAYWLRRFI